MVDALIPLQRVRVHGPSMVPTLRDGDVVLVWYGLRGRVVPRTGDVVLAQFRSMPGHDVLKRVEQARDGGWWLRSDNVAAGGDSSVHGVGEVRARVIARWRGGSFPGSWVPRRVR